jgi:hypothetical protein
MSLNKHAELPLVPRDCFDLQRCAIACQSLLYKHKKGRIKLPILARKYLKIMHKQVWELSCRMHKELWPDRHGVTMVRPGQMAVVMPGEEMVENLVNILQYQKHRQILADINSLAIKEAFLKPRRDTK